MNTITNTVAAGQAPAMAHRIDLPQPAGHKIVVLLVTIRVPGENPDAFSFYHVDAMYMDLQWAVVRQNLIQLVQASPTDTFVPEGPAQTHLPSTPLVGGESEPQPVV
ncbi:hypothetical protein AMAG_14286 [Allomyces macrogynus ATCC 38327]|uniref:Uncharacterized protein n=1 Tax=Allomyces macrogynus (strain ATCC 38327) TaxID=578462 RepID=A0A0L0T4S2_ALLM3|nr:hypothetical protein AMAG_14286 [Allomyces macrogynus ATCC 38327]|eukprot:KNE69745.1 hypothetical protein AMAG_14286 [Allomyces macrogynus ATCC 38327]